MREIYSRGLSRGWGRRTSDYAFVERKCLPGLSVPPKQLKKLSSKYVKAAREEQEISETEEGPEFVLSKADTPRFRINSIEDHDCFLNPF